jgi:hypothetical protein
MRCGCRSVFDYFPTRTLFLNTNLSDRLACSRAMRDRHGLHGVTGLASWNYTRSHQRVVLYEPGSDTYLGGSVLDIAEDFLQSRLCRGETIDSAFLSTECPVWLITTY